MKHTMLAIALTVSMASTLDAVRPQNQVPETKLSIFVGPQTREGFIDVDSGILDSIKGYSGRVSTIAPVQRHEHERSRHDRAHRCWSPNAGRLWCDWPADRHDDDDASD
jgi:hypothetical protein